jgi:hypothetical protein
MKRSAKVTLTLIAAMGLGERAESGVTGAIDPCDAATFNPKSCKTAVQTRRYCAPDGQRLPVIYAQSYPYYYDQYQAHLTQGGAVNPAPTQRCGNSSSHGGFGATGAGHHYAGS